MVLDLHDPGYLKGWRSQTRQETSSRNNFISHIRDVISKSSIETLNKYLRLQGLCLNPYLTKLLTHGDQIAGRKHQITHLEINRLHYVLQWMPCVMHDYKYEWDGWALWWRWRWRRLGFADEDDDEEVLASELVSLLTFRWGPFNQSFLGGQSASEFVPVWNTVYCVVFVQTSPRDSLFLHFPSNKFPHVISYLFSPFPVETHQREDLWNPLHSLVTRSNIKVNFSVLMKYLDLNKGWMSVKISLINSPSLNLIVNVLQVHRV